jgi:hypothetical protein
MPTFEISFCGFLVAKHALLAMVSAAYEKKLWRLGLPTFARRNIAIVLGQEAPMTAHRSSGMQRCN